MMGRSPELSSLRNIVSRRYGSYLTEPEKLTDVRVLLAEPDETQHGVFVKYLTRCGAAVALATSGVECIEQLRAFQPHVLVMEPELPWGGGVGVLDWMLSDPVIPTTPVIALTAARDLDLLRHLLGFPLHDLVVKPITPRQLLTKIRWVVDFAPSLDKNGWPR